jgi:O-antigen biosynthesis protein
VSFQRRAGAPRLIDWTGERCVPWAPDVPVIYEHYHRYLWARRLVGGSRVLDLGSGEGFGAALLAESAAHVIGLDVDARTIEHSQLNYGGPNLEFALGTAVDLTAYEDASFGAVVAFEIIEHVREQERVLAEVARVLSDDGILVISTPDRRMYGEMRAEPNPFHERELGFEEFLELVGGNFTHLATWGQRTIAGSHLDALAPLTADEDAADASEDFFIERAGDEWRLARAPAALYYITLASKAPLPAVGTTSTLADCGLELMRVKEGETMAAVREGRELSARLEREKQEILARLEGEKQELSRSLERGRAAVAQRDRQARQAAKQRDQEVRGAEEELSRSQQAVVLSERAILDLRELLASVENQLASAHRANRRTEESVTWQAFQKSRARLYGAIGGERSLLARLLGASLRFAGRRLASRPAATPLASPADPAPEPAEIIQMPEFDNPQVSLIIPLHAQAELTRACLRSIREHTSRVSYEVIIVDDAADAETRRLLDGVSGATILRNEENLGYLRSMNRGASVARGEWLVLFNNDTEVTRGWLSSLLACANSAADVGVVTPKFIYPDGSLNEAGGIIWRDGTGVNYGRGDSPDRYQYEYRRETDYGSAAALMVSAELWKETGGFSELYLPMYYEDTDLCFEARERGLRVLYEPEAVVVHIEGATAGRDPKSGHKRFQEENRHRFVAKWQKTLEAEHRYPAPLNVRMAADRHRGQHVLVVDHRVPMWDRDSGSLRMLRMMQSLGELGARVTFLPDNLGQVQPYARELQRMGIEVLYGHLDVNAELATIGPELTAAILCRPHPTSRWLDLIREFAPTAMVAYDTVDLHWLREARRGSRAISPSELVGSKGTLDPLLISPRAKALRELELAMIRATDVTLVVSDDERVQVEQDVPGTRVLVVPNVHDVEQYVAPPEDRAGILFIGGFEHIPNVDAAVRLVTEVMPDVWAKLGDVWVTIVGSDPPPEVQALASPRVDIIGWVEDIQPLLERSRLMAAPLRYGAGLKGKVTQCLAAGLPVVTTSIGAEGLVDTRVRADGDIRAEEQCLLIADGVRDFAAETIQLYRDDELWRRMSRAGQARIGELCSREVVSRRLSELLGLMPSSVADDGATQPA